jgi:eukaryotic-like serine/threonine-protein kinase
VLAALLERPGQTVTREDLKARIWPEDTFVDFDLGLNKAVNRIRDALTDSAATPRYIETIPRRGYRFIGVVDGVAPLPHAPVAAAPRLRSSLLPPPNSAYLLNQFAISPDGSRLAFVAADSGRAEMLWVRDLASGRCQPLNDTEGSREPFWRPDSRHIGFFAHGKLKTIDIAGGAVNTLCAARVAIGGAWHSNDVILFAGQVSGPLLRITADGGASPVPVTPAPGADSAQLHCCPVFLPGTDTFLYYANRTSPADEFTHGIYAGSLTATDVHLVSSEIDGNVAFAAGHLFFVKDGSLCRQPFDARSLQLAGDPVPVAPQEMETSEVVFRSGFSISDTGILILQSRLDFARDLIWTDTTGREYERIPGGFVDPAISPDGRMVAASYDEHHNGRWLVCVHDCERGVTTPLTNIGHERVPSWSPDGKRIIFNSFEGHNSCTYEVAADGSGTAQMLLKPFSVLPHCSCEGAIVYSRVGGGSPKLMVRLPETGQAVEIGPGAEPQFSPDGKWIAFTEWGGAGIHVMKFPSPGPLIRVSKGRGAQPRWSHDGTQLFYVTPDKLLMAATFDPATGQAGAPRELFQTRIARASLVAWQYDVAPEGHFLINSLPAGAPPLTLLVGL